MYLFNRNKGVNQPLHLTERGKHLFLLSYLTVVILKAHPFSAERVEAAEREVIDVDSQEQTSEATSLEMDHLSFVLEEDEQSESLIQSQQVFEPVTTLSDEDLLEQPALYTSAIAASSAAVPTVTTPVSELMTTSFDLKEDIIYWKHEFNPGFVDREEMNWFFSVPASVATPTDWKILRYDPKGELVEGLTDWWGDADIPGISYEAIDFISGKALDKRDLSILEMIKTVDFEGYRQVLESSQTLHYLLKVKNYQAQANRWVVTYQTKVIDKKRTPDYLVGLDSTDSREPKQLKRILVDYGKNLFPDLKKPEQPKVWPVYAGDHSISGRTDPYLLVTVSMVNGANGRDGVTPTMTNGVNGVGGIYTAKSDSAGHFRVGIPEAKANDQFTVDVASVLGIRSDLLTLTVGVPTGTTPAIQTTSDDPGHKVVSAIKPPMNMQTGKPIHNVTTPIIVIPDPGSEKPNNTIETAITVSPDLELEQPNHTPAISTDSDSAKPTVAAAISSDSGYLSSESPLIAMPSQSKSAVNTAVIIDSSPNTFATLVQQAKTLLKDLMTSLPKPSLTSSVDSTPSIDEKGKITIKPVPGTRQMKVTYHTKSGQKKLLTIRQNDKGTWESSDGRLLVDKETGLVSLFANDMAAGTTLSVEMVDKGNQTLETSSLEIPSLPATPKLLPYKGDILVLPPEEAVELLLSYKDATGYMHVIEAYKNSQTNNWESTSDEIFLSSGLSLIIIPNRSLAADADLVVTTRNAAGFFSQDLSERVEDILTKSEVETEKHLENYLRDNR